MKYSVKQYAAALVAALREKSDSEQRETARRFFVLLHRHGLWSRRLLILKEVERQFLKEHDARKVAVAAALPLSSKTRREIERTVGKNIFWQETVEPELLAGIKILVDDEILIDASAKRYVKRLFTR